MKKTTLSLIIFLLLCNLNYAQKVQIINNTGGDYFNKKIDVFFDRELIADDLEYRSATAFKSVSASTNVKIAVGLFDAHCADCTVYSKRAALEKDKNYIVVVDGTYNEEGYSPWQPLKIYIYEKGKTSGDAPTSTDLLLHHGSTDAPTTVDVAKNGQTVVDDLEYGKFTDYLSIPAVDGTIDLLSGDGKLISTYDVPLASLNLKGKAGVVVASGFVDPSKNKNGPSFGLWLALAEGGKLVELQKNLSVSDFDLSSTSLFPNPVINELTVSYDDFKDTSISITDVTGKSVLSSPLTSNKTQINVSQLSSGLYFARLVKNNSFSEVVKIRIK